MKTSMRLSYALLGCVILAACGGDDNFVPATTLPEQKDTGTPDNVVPETGGSAGTGGSAIAGSGGTQVAGSAGEQTGGTAGSSGSADAGVDVVVSPDADAATEENDAAIEAETSMGGSAGSSGSAGAGGIAGSGGSAGSSVGGSAGSGGCSAPTDCPATGNDCVYRTCTAGTCGTMVIDGMACNDGNGCTTPDKCQSGTCIGTPALGAACGTNGVCNAQGQCVGCLSPNDCPVSTDACLIASCDENVCGFKPITDGSPCSDNNACTLVDICQAGVCVGTSQKTCQPSDQCHNAGTCEPTTGSCSNPLKGNGTSCDDNNPCTQTDTCWTGVCTGSNQVVCVATEQCHVGVCDVTTGTCLSVPGNDGGSCSDGNACTQTDKCQSGMCVGSNPITCSPSDQCNTVACNSSTGTCDTTPLMNGTGCNDNNACTQTDTCQNGACVGTNSITCPAPDACHYLGTCDVTSGVCSNPARPDGWACQNGTCQAGTCVTPGCHAMKLTTSVSRLSAPSTGWGVADGDWTLEMWVKLHSDFAQAGGLIALNEEAVTNKNVTMTVDASGKITCVMHINGAPCGKGTGCMKLTSYSLNDSAWHHVACVRTGGGGNLYVDGVSADTDTASYSLASLSNISFGKLNGYPSSTAAAAIVGPFRFSSISRYATAFTPSGVWTVDANTVTQYLVDSAFDGVTLIDEAGGNNNSSSITNVVPFETDTHCQ